MTLKHNSISLALIKFKKHWGSKANPFLSQTFPSVAEDGDGKLLLPRAHQFLFCQPIYFSKPNTASLSECTCKDTEKYNTLPSQALSWSGSKGLSQPEAVHMVNSSSTPGVIQISTKKWKHGRKNYFIVFQHFLQFISSYCKFHCKLSKFVF